MNYCRILGAGFLLFFLSTSLAQEEAEVVQNEEVNAKYEGSVASDDQITADAPPEESVAEADAPTKESAAQADAPTEEFVAEVDDPTEKLTPHVEDFTKDADTSSKESADSDFLKVKQVSGGNVWFAMDLLTELVAANPLRNVLFSPIGISSVIGMAYAGAKGETAAQIQKGMHYSEDSEAVLSAIQAVQKTLYIKPSVTLEMFNRLFIDKSFDLLPEYTEKSLKYYGTTPVPVDFSDTQEAAKTINEHMFSLSKGKFKHFVSPDRLNSNSTLLLVNGLYFTARWQFNFLEKSTTYEKFYVSEFSAFENVRMMHRRGRFFLAETPEIDARVLILPYEDKITDMFFILPNTIGGFNSTLAKLKSNYSYEHLSTALKEVVVDVTIPRFKGHSVRKLKDQFINLGMIDMFSPSADFSGMSSQSGLHVSDVIQKNFLKVNERGYGSAETNSVVMNYYHRKKFEPIHTFNANHPFLYILADIQTGTTLFIGAFQAPF